MATKAQLIAELDFLKQQMASRDGTLSDKTDSEKPTNHTDADADSDPKSHLGTLLASHGIDEDEIEALWSQLTGELGNLTREKPLLTAVSAFGLGFVLGRMSK